MNFHILTLFPEMIDRGLSDSIIGRAREQGLVHIQAVNIRDFSENKHRKVDDYTYGGGAGMLMQAQPVYDAWRSVAGKKRPRTVYVTPQGRPFDQNLAADFSKEEELVILCGHYEGVDERVLEEVVTDYVSIGDYVLTGGELAAMVMIDAIARLVPGVLHNADSADTESFQGRLLEYPQYSRPEIWKEKSVPEVLLSGDTRKINEWRREQSELRTRERRPDLYREYVRLQEAQKKMRAQKLLHMDMIELICRGQAELLYEEGGEILLRDLRTGILFHTDMETPDHKQTLWESEEKLPDLLLEEKRKTEEKGEKISVVFHQKKQMERYAGELGLRQQAVCLNAVWTPREKMPVRGLYRPDGMPVNGGSTGGLVIRQLDESALETVCRYSDFYLGEDYYRQRLRQGQMFGAFFGSGLAGFAGFHPEGSTGMLAVLPEYRRRHVGMALETFMMNRQMEQGYTPYAQILQENHASLALQKKLGLHLSKDPVFWTEG